MSGSTAVAVSGGGGDMYRPPFTAVQWQELEHQALIYKYMVAGVPVPSDLVLPIRRSLEALSATFFNNPTLGYCSYYGKKFDPEPGRCRRTDGKKWRCAKEAYHESKYCERHMHRGRNRSRKPVESQSASQSLSNAVNSTGTGTNSTRSPSQSLFSITNSGGFDFGSNASNLQVDTGSYVINNKDLRYAQGLTQNYPSGGNVDGSWCLIPSQIPTNSVLKPQNDSYNVKSTFVPMIDTTSMSKQRQHHCFFGSEIGTTEQVKNEQDSMRSFFNEWPKAKEQWPNLDSTTQLSMSMDPDFTARNACPPNDA